MKKAAKVSIIIAASVVAAIAVAVGVFFLLIEPRINILGAPELDVGRLTSYSRTLKITDRYGEPISDALYDSDKCYVRLADLRPHTVNAFIAIEDKRFYEHGGIDYRRVGSALISNIRSGKFNEGASTITQQLIKNTHLSNKKTIKRKLNEMRLARALEREYDKDFILENYFNILYFGSGIRGLGTASRVMFDIPASELSLAQSAALASIINNPSKYSPYKNIDDLTARKNLVLSQMLAQKLISEEEYAAAREEALVFGKKRQIQYTEGVLKEACKALKCSEKALFADNYTVFTSYEPKIAAAVRSAITSADIYDGSVQIRVLVLDNIGGGIACDETNCDKYIDPKRSPASTVKPFISYAPALERGYYTVTQINDVRTDFGDYSPANYKNIYRGYCSLEQCLAYSSNVAAVKLCNDVGLENAISTAKKFGLPFSERDNSLAVALGGFTDGVTLAELANAYRTLANDGIYAQTGYISSIGNLYGSVYTPEYAQAKAVEEDTAYLVTDMLVHCSEYGTAKKLNGLSVAAKTGTNGDSDGNTDCYCIAYTPSYTIAVWYGAADSPMDNNVTGATCCDIVKNIIDSGTIKTEPFTMPDSVAYYEIDGNELLKNHEVYLADPTLPKRYRVRALMSKRNLPIKRHVDIIDYFDRLSWNAGDMIDMFFHR